MRRIAVGGAHVWTARQFPLHAVGISVVLFPAQDAGMAMSYGLVEVALPRASNLPIKHLGGNH